MAIFITGKIIGFPLQAWYSFRHLQAKSVFISQLRNSHWIGGFMNGWHTHHKGKADSKRILRNMHCHRSKRRKWKRNQRPGVSRMLKSG